MINEDLVEQAMLAILQDPRVFFLFAEGGI